MSIIETRALTELRAAGREITGLVAPYYQAARVRNFSEVFVPGSLELPSVGVPLHSGHPSGRPHDEASMPVCPPGEFAEGTVDGTTGMLGRWHAPHSAAAEALLEGIHSGRQASLSVGFLPDEGADDWSADRSAVTRHGAILHHVAAVPRGAHDGARVLEVRASSLSHAERMALYKKGQALGDGSYPVPDVEHLHAAAVLAASHHGNWQAAQKLIRRRAAELGVPLESLPGFGKAAENRMDGYVALELLRIDRLLQDRLVPPGRTDGRAAIARLIRNFR